MAPQVFSAYNGRMNKRRDDDHDDDENACRECGAREDTPCALECPNRLAELNDQANAKALPTLEEVTRAYGFDQPPSPLAVRSRPTPPTIHVINFGTEIEPFPRKG